MENTDPALASVTVSPLSAKVGESLTCAAVATDADGGSPTITYTWSDGALGSTRVVSSVTSPGDTITCTATADDGDGGVVSGTASAMVDNTDPEMGTVSVSSDTAKVGRPSPAATATDVDGGTPTMSYVWSTGDTGASLVITSAEDPGDTLTCTATATDADGGTDTGTASAVVTNTNPVVGLVMVTPGTAKVGASVTCSASATDADGGTPTLSYAWSTGDTGPSIIMTSAGDPGDAITCTVTATDEDGGEGTGTGTVTIDNTAPEVDAVSISPDPAYNDDTLVCTATASDADGDTPTLSYRWTGGATGASLPLTSIIAVPGDTLSVPPPRPTPWRDQ